MITLDRTRLIVPLMSACKFFMGKMTKKQLKEYIYLLIIMMAGFVLFIIVNITSRHNESETNILRVYTVDGYGSGFIYEVKLDKLIIVTAGHVVDNLTDEYVEVVFSSNNKLRGRVISVNKDYDVAFVEVDINPQDMTKYKDILYTSAYEAINGEKYVIPYLDDEYIIQTSGLELSNLEEYIYDLNRIAVFGYGNVYEGLSGAPIIDDDGFIYGMIFAANSERVVVGTSMKDIDRIYNELTAK